MPAKQRAGWTPRTDEAREWFALGVRAFDRGATPPPYAWCRGWRELWIYRGWATRREEVARQYLREMRDAPSAFQREHAAKGAAAWRAGVALGGCPERRGTVEYRAWRDGWSAERLRYLENLRRRTVAA